MKERENERKKDGGIRERERESKRQSKRDSQRGERNRMTERECKIGREKDRQLVAKTEETY